MRSIFFNGLMTLILFGSFWVLQAAAQTPIWGPVVVTREAGQPVTVVKEFSVPDATWQYTLHVETGDDISDRVSTAEITINGDVVADQSEFNEQVSEITKPVALQTENQITIWVGGIPGTQLSVSILGPHTLGSIGAEGGSVALAGIVEATFSAGLFPESTTVAISVGSHPGASEMYEFTEAAFAAGPRLPFEVYILADTAPATGEVEVSIAVPPTFSQSLPPDYSVNVMLQLYQSGDLHDMEGIVPYVTEYDELTGRAKVVLPSWIFSSERRTDSKFEAILTIGSVPNN